MAKKILFVAMQASIHTVRWCQQLSDSGWELHLFAINQEPAHPELRGVTLHQPRYMIKPRVWLKKIIVNSRLICQRQKKLEFVQCHNNLIVKTIHRIPMLSKLFIYYNRHKRIVLSDSVITAPASCGPKILAKLIKKLKPDLIHSLEFQHCGYNVLRAKEILGDDFPPWFATSWGSDIFYYKQFDLHRNIISRLLKNANYYSCECMRDVHLAKELGYTGMVMPPMPVNGGFDIEKAWAQRNIHPLAKRKVIMVKGYQSFAGRALTALDAIERCFEHLIGYKIIVYSASRQIYGRIDQLRYIGLDVQIIPSLRHDEMVNLFSAARIYLGVSVSDGISTSLLEAMAMGAFPIQTNTSCCEEWIEDGKSGFEIPVDIVEVIADRLRTALADDALVEQAAKMNWETVRTRVDYKVLKQKSIAQYDAIFSDIASSSGNQKKASA